LAEPVFLISAERLARLKWRARRGLLENDLLVTRFFEKHLAISEEDANGLEALFHMTDNDLLELILGRKELEGELARPDVQHVLEKLRCA
jgi:antitoxin CptB